MNGLWAALAVGGSVVVLTLASRLQEVQRRSFAVRRRGLVIALAAAYVVGFGIAYGIGNDDPLWLTAARMVLLAVFAYALLAAGNRRRARTDAAVEANA